MKKENRKMAQILLGKEVTASLNEEIEEKVKTLKEHQVMPKLGIIRIGEKQDDIAYERNAVKVSASGRCNGRNSD